MLLRVCLCFGVMLVMTTPARPQENSNQETQTLHQPAQLANSTQAETDEEIKKMESQVEQEKKMLVEEKTEVDSIKAEVEGEDLKTTIADFLAGLASILSGIAAFRDQLRSLLGRGRV